MSCPCRFQYGGRVQCHCKRLSSPCRCPLPCPNCPFRRHPLVEGFESSDSTVWIVVGVVGGLALLATIFGGAVVSQVHAIPQSN